MKHLKYFRILAISFIAVLMISGIILQRTGIYAQTTGGTPSTEASESGNDTSELTESGATEAAEPSEAGTTETNGSDSSPSTEEQITTDLSSCQISLSYTSCTYNGKARKPTPTVTLTTDSETVTLKKNTDYTVSYSNNKKAGTAKVTVKGKGNYSGSASQEFTIKKKSVSKATVTLSKTSYTYNGSARKPGATVTLTLNGETVKLKKNTDYTVTYSSNTKAGTAKVKIKGKGNYSGSVTQTFTIKKKSLSKATVKLSKTSYTYSGKAKKPSTTVKLTLNDKTVTLKKGTDYTVTYKSNTKVGTAKVTIKGKGNYSGSVSKTFTIKPKATSISKYSVSGNSISVTLKKVSSQATGYQVQYATNSKFTKNKVTKKISSYKTVTKKLTGLKYKTTYYVRVRTYKTVGDKKYYSAWSTATKIKTGSKGAFKTVNGLTYYKYDDGSKVTDKFLTVDSNTYYFDSDGVMMTGWMEYDGEYYYFDRETGVMQTGCTVNDVTLDKNGKAEQTDYTVSKIEVMIKARAIMNEITEPTDSKETKLKKCFDWVLSHPYKQYRKLRVARVDYPDTWMMVFANDEFETGKGCCVSEASTFSFLATECGYTAYIADDTGHAWTEIDGLVYDTLFAEVKGYTNYYGASYKSAGFWCVNRTLI